MSAIQPTPYQVEQRQIKIAKLIIVAVALVTLATFGAIYRDSLFAFLKEHMEFSTILLPAAAAGMGLGILVNQSKSKKQIALAITVFLAALAVIAHVNALQTIQNASLAVGAGLLGFFMFHAKEKAPEVGRNGEPLMSPNCEFAYGEVNGQWKEMSFENKEVCIAGLKSETVKNDPPAVGQIIAKTVMVCGLPNNFYYKVTAVDPLNGNIWGRQLIRGFYSPSQKRVDEEGNSYYPVYVYDPIGKKQKRAAFGWLGVLIRAPLGIAFDLISIPFYIIYLLGRLLCYDLWVSEDKMELLGNRFFEILSVPGESIKGSITNALCGVAGLFGSFAMIIEGFKHGRPMNSQKALAKIEQIQNEVGVHQSFWSIHGPQAHFKGLKADLEMSKDQKINLRQYGFYIFGCCQPFDLLKVDSQGKIVGMIHISSPEYWTASNIQIKDYDLNSKEDWDPNLKSYLKVTS